MKRRRTLVHVFAVLALLVQGVASAAPMTHAAPASSAHSMPCHAEKAASLKAACAFCGTHCDCASACTGPALAPVSGLVIASLPRADFTPAARTPLLLPPHRLDRLRPPIALQS